MSIVYPQASNIFEERTRDQKHKLAWFSLEMQSPTHPQI